MIPYVIPSVTSDFWPYDDQGCATAITKRHVSTMADSGDPERPECEKHYYSVKLYPVCIHSTTKEHNSLHAAPLSAHYPCTATVSTEGEG